MVILKMMAPKIIECFSQSLDILKQLLKLRKGLSDESIKHPAMSDNSLNPGINTSKIS